MTSHHSATTAPQALDRQEILAICDRLIQAVETLKDCWIEDAGLHANPKPVLHMLQQEAE